MTLWRVLGLDRVSRGPVWVASPVLLDRGLSLR